MKRMSAPVSPVGLDVSQAAQLIGVGVSTFYGLRRDDPSFPAPREIAPNVARYLAHELLAWLDSRPKVERAPEPAQLSGRRYRDGRLVEAPKRQSQGAA